MPHAGSDVIVKILTELDVIKWRLSELEHRMGMLERMLEEKVGVTVTTEEEEPVSEGEMERTQVHAMSAITAIRQARMAVYGYSRLIKKLGLPENVNELVSFVDSMVAMMFRLQYAIMMVQTALTLLEAHPLMAMFKLGVAGGMFALAVAQGSRTIGG